MDSCKLPFLIGVDINLTPYNLLNYRLRSSGGTGIGSRMRQRELTEPIGVEICCSGSDRAG